MKHFFKKKTLKLTLLFSSLVIVMSCGVAIVLAVMSYTGYTDLTTSGQTIKASSAPTAILGININNGGDGQTLTSVSVDFTSVSGFTNNDLASGKVVLLFMMTLVQVTEYLMQAMLMLAHQ